MKPLRALEKHLWPGNIRELKNVVERAVYRSDAATITDIEFHPFHSPYENAALPVSQKTHASEMAPADSGVWLGQPLKAAVWELKVKMLEAALDKAKYSQKKAARILGLTYHQFRGLYRQYQATRPDKPSS